MQEKHLFEYSVIRVVPKVEREEFLNAGIVLYCAGKGYLKTIFELNESRLQAFSNEIESGEIESRLAAFVQICNGGKGGGPIGKLPIASRFRWLTAKRSTVIQLSPVHPGFCHDPDETLHKLFTQLVK